MTNTNTNTTTDTDTDTTTTTTTTTGAPSGPTAVANPVTWFEIHSAEPARAKEFYRCVFGWSFDESMPEYTEIQLGDGAPIGGGIVDNGGNYPNDAIFMIQVPDVAAAIAAARHAGGSVIADAQTPSGGPTFGYVANPDGAVFGIWCPPG